IRLLILGSGYNTMISHLGLIRTFPKVHTSGFVAPYTLSQGLDRTLKFEFVHDKKDDITFVSE
ncbi:hypothetical protein ACFH1K_11505, partial [Citrobacter farmeri]